MKKNFKLNDEKLVKERHVDAIKHEINKYIARERRKKLTDGVDFWDFDCRFGVSENDAEVIHLSEINKKIDQIVLKDAESFYLEILAKTGKRTAKKK